MIIDILFLIIIAFAIFKGLKKGLIMAIFSMFSFIIGLAAALKFSVFTAAKLSPYTGNTQWLPFFSFFLVLIAVMVLVKIAGGLIEKTFQTVMLGWANRIAGVILYVFLYGVIYSIILFYAVELRYINQEIAASSFVYPYLETLGIQIIDNYGTVIPWLENIFEELEKFLSLFSERPH